MGSGDWFKTVLRLRTVKYSNSKQVKKSSSSAKSSALKWSNTLRKESPDMPVEVAAATQIQTAFRAYMEEGKLAFSSGEILWIMTVGFQDAMKFTDGHNTEHRIPKNQQSMSYGKWNTPETKPWGCVDLRPVYQSEQHRISAGGARKSFRRLKGIVRLQKQSLGCSVKKQSTSTLAYLHSWGKIQSQIRDRRLYMVTEGRTKQKKLENQRRLEAKLHEVEVEWCGGPETMDAILARIHDQEEAAVKRERAMAYAFSHQWRANSNQIQRLGKDELGKSNWGWSWKERWIAARPWESRVTSLSNSPKKVLSRQSSKAGKKKNSLSPKIPVLVKSLSPNGKPTAKAKRLFYPASEKLATLDSSKKVEEDSKTDNLTT